VLDRFAAKLLEKGGERKAQLSPDSVGSYLHSVNTFLKWCAKEGEAVAAKAATPKAPRRILPVLSRDEINHLERAAGNEREVEQACVRATEALELAVQLRHTESVGRVESVHPRMCRWSAHGSVRDLGDQLRAANAT
jgi:hypothetical protein